jgi:hypothetical protein
MAKKITYNDVHITVAEYDGALLFNRTEIAQSLGYSGTIAAIDGAKCITIGNHQYFQLVDLNQSLSRMKGDRKALVAGFIREVYEQYAEQLDDKTPTSLECLDDLAREWVTARIEVKAAFELHNETLSRENELFNKLNEERNSE